MPFIFVSPYEIFQNLLSVLSENPKRTVYLPVGIHQRKEEITLLARRGDPAFSERDISGRYLKVSLTSGPLGFFDWLSKNF